MRKNILILNHSYGPPFAEVADQYAQLFSPQKYAVTCAYLFGKPDEEVRKRTPAENVIFFNLSKEKNRALKINAVKKLIDLVREYRFHLVICHRYKPLYIMLLSSKCCRVPFIISVIHEFGAVSSLRRKLFLACFARKNILFAGVSNAVRDDLRKNLWLVPRSNILTLYNAMDIHSAEAQLLSKEAARQQLGLPQQAFVFGTLGRLVKNKDQATLIKAFALIKPHCPCSKLILLGTGNLENDLKKEASNCGLQEDVIFAGFVEGGFRYMKAFDCFVLPSVQEAFGRVLLEAMTAKLPVIASRAGGMSEVVGSAGILVQPNHPREFADAMQFLYDLPEKEREKFQEKSYQQVLNYFSNDVFRKQFWESLNKHSGYKNLSTASEK